MSGKQKFFVCKLCGNMTGLINDKGGKMVCCGAEMSELVAQIPLGRPGRPEEVAHLAEYLLRAEYVTGQIMTLDGGLGARD